MHRQPRFIFGHRRVVEVEFLAPVKTIERIKNKRLGDFTRAISPIVVEQNRIAVLERRNWLTRFVHDGGRSDKFIAGLALIQRRVVILLHGLGCARGGGDGGFSGE